MLHTHVWHDQAGHKTIADHMVSSVPGVNYVGAPAYLIVAAQPG